MAVPNFVGFFARFGVSNGRISKAHWGYRPVIFHRYPQISPWGGPAVNDDSRMSLDSQFARNALFLFNFFPAPGRSWTLSEVPGKRGLVGRLGLEPRTKALKG